MNKKEFSLRLIVFISLAIALFAFLGFHGTISSGFHFVDNHEVVKINKDYLDTNGNALEVVRTWVTNDLGGRFRPMYMVDNVFVDLLFKGDFFSISIYHTFLMVFIAFFLFLFFRKTGFSITESIAFPLIAFIGPQSAILWRLGPNESIGMWYLSLTLVSIVYAVKSKKHQRIFQILFVCFATLMMLCKESFLILIPAIVLGYIYLEKSENDATTWLAAIKKHLLEVSILIVLFFVSLAFIFMTVNTENLGYAGVKGVDYSAYLISFTTLFLKGGIGLVSMILFLLSVFLGRRGKGEKKAALLNHFWVFMLAMAIVLPQVILYGKSGIFERYFLPGMLAWALLLAFSLRNIRLYIVTKFNGKYSRIFLLAEIVLLLCLLIPRYVYMAKNASAFTTEGKEVNTVLSFIAKNIDSTDSVLFIADPVTDFERTISFRRFLDGTYGLTHIYTLPIIQPNTNDFGYGLIKDFWWVMGGEEMHFDKLSDKNVVQAIVVFPLLADNGDQIISDLGYKSTDFNSFRIGNYHLYFKNNSSLGSTSSKFKSEELRPYKEVYNETAFNPELLIKKGDNVQLIIKPSTEIAPPMVAFVILLDAAHPENIAVHQQIEGAGDIVVSKLIEKSMEKPCLIYRNWGKEQSIPSANITISSKPKTEMIIPIR